MGTRTAQSILDRAWIKAQDNEAVNKRWGEDEGLMWVNDFQVETVNHLPRSYTQSAVVTAEFGTRQTLSGLGLPRGLQPIDVIHNVTAADGIGSAITKVPRAFMDETKPNWHLEGASEAQHWMTDDEDPKAFYIYPYITGSGKYRLVYSATPADLASLSQAILLDDVFSNAGQYYVLFCFYSKDLASIKSAQMAQMYYSLFTQALGIRDQKLSISEAKSNAKQQGA
jgi:hypothetical protein